MDSSFFNPKFANLLYSSGVLKNSKGDGIGFIIVRVNHINVKTVFTFNNSVRI